MKNLDEYLKEQSRLCREHDYITSDLFHEHNVNRGLRDKNGIGVLTGLTSISKIQAYKEYLLSLIHIYDMSIFTEQEDLEAVLSMIQNLEYVDTDHIFLLGSSQGGLVSAITAADHRDEIAGAVLLYPAFVLVDDAKERFDRPGDVPETYPHLFMTCLLYTSRCV